MSINPLPRQIPPGQAAGRTDVLDAVYALECIALTVAERPPTT